MEMKKSPFTILRVFTSLIFIYASTNHFFQSDKIFTKVSKTAAYQLMQNKSLFEMSILLSGITMLVGGIALLAGYKNKLAAIVLLIMLIPITLTVQLNNFSDLGPFFKNVAIAGSLLFIINYKSNEIETPVVRSSNLIN
jgi:putative oxidoreductase